MRSRRLGHAINVLDMINDDKSGKKHEAVTGDDMVRTWRRACLVDSLEQFQCVTVPSCWVWLCAFEMLMRTCIICRCVPPVACCDRLCLYLCV